ncbi:MAG TPA: D-glycero-beta-D-manno-heptose 1-phosphate adenylyltransferase [Gammaproteobacteria bacterium]
MINLENFIHGFKTRRVLVIGDAILDVYEKGVTERLCREAPVPIVVLNERICSCGGAANTAVNAAALGARVELLTVIGADTNGDELVRTLEAGNVDTRCVFRAADRRTVAKTRICASSSILVRVDEGNTGPITDATAEAIASRLRPALHEFDVIILSDYDYGVFSGRLLARLTELFSGCDAPVVVDAKHPERFRALAPAAVKPNYAETAALLNLPKRQGADRIAQLLDKSGRLLERTGAGIVVATLDGNGAIVFERDQAAYSISCLPQPDAKTIGAGDSFTAALALSLSVGAPAKAAARIAAAAAAVAIGEDGTGICSNDGLRAHFHGRAKRVESIGELMEKLAAARQCKRRIVFTNGCFDILRRGHVEFLNQAKALGDVLVVALNSDAGIRRLKGDDRPVNTLEDRVEVLAGLEAVDFIVTFDSDSPADLLKKIRPDIFAKGGTYSVDSLPEAELVRSLGGQIEIVPFHGGFSTRRLIEKIQLLNERPATRQGEQRAL